MLAWQLSLLRHRMRFGANIASELDQYSRAILPLLENKDCFSWKGEAYFALARAAEIANQQARALAWYSKAEPALQEIGCGKKALRAYMNGLAARSFLEPGTVLVFEYFQGYQRARALLELPVAGTCLLNVSRELQKLGACFSALKFANLAVRYQENDPGTLGHFLAHAHRCDLLIDMQRFSEARLDLDRLRIGTHREVSDLLPHLERKMARFEHEPFVESPRNLSSERLTTSWQERLVEDRNEKKTLGTQEERLIALLLLGARSRSELIRELWGEKIFSESGEFRFKQLLQRVRSKVPGLVHYERGRYQLFREEKCG